jgi:gas vesicle protein
MREMLWMALLLGSVIGGCNKSENPATATAPTAGEKLKEDVKQAGRDIRDVATQAATEVKPAIENVTEKGRELIHEGAQKVSDWTGSRPATEPGTLPTTRP